MLPEEEGGTLYSASERMLPRHPWGTIDTSQLLHLLNQHGLIDIRVEDTPRGVIIHMVILLHTIKSYPESLFCQILLFGKTSVYIIFILYYIFNIFYSV